MKNLLTIAILLFSMASYAQGNLQFNQVLTYSGILNCGQSSAAWSVPTNKVWKVEYHTPVNGNPNYDNGIVVGPIGPLLSINSVPISDLSMQSVYLTTGSTQNNSNTKWLKANDQIQFTLYNLIGNNGCGGYTKYNYSISIIEYNIVP